MAVDLYTHTLYIWQIVTKILPKLSMRFSEILPISRRFHLLTALILNCNSLFLVKEALSKIIMRADILKDRGLEKILKY